MRERSRLRTKKHPELHKGKDCTSDERRDISWRILRLEHLSTDGVPNAVADEHDGADDGLLGTSGDIRSDKGPDN